MNSNAGQVGRWSQALLTGLLVGVSIYAIYLRRELGRAEDRLQVARAQPAAGRAKAVEHATPPPSGGVENAPQPVAAVAPKLPEETAASHDEAVYQEFLKYRDKRQLRLMYYTYGGTLRRLNLSALDTHRAAELLAERDISIKEARVAANTVGLGPLRLGDAVAAATKEVEAKLVALIGAEGLARVNKTPIVGMLESALSVSLGVDLRLAGVPFTGDQAGTVAQLLAEAQDPSRNPMLGQMVQLPVNPVTGLSRIHETVVNRAAAVLSARQLALLQAYFREQDSPRADAATYALKKD